VRGYAVSREPVTNRLLDIIIAHVAITDQQRLSISHNAYTPHFTRSLETHGCVLEPSALMRALLVPRQPRFFSEQRLPDVQARAATRIADVSVN